MTVADGHYELNSDLHQNYYWGRRGRDRMVHFCSWIYNYLCNQCLSPPKLWVRIPFRWGVLDTTLCDEVCQWLAAGRWFYPGTSVSSTKKTDRHDITEILLKMAFNTVNQTKPNHGFILESHELKQLCILYLTIKLFHFRLS